MKISKYFTFLESVGEIRIKDIGSYIDGMKLSYMDKLFFLNKIDADIIVDFGCADGFILSKIRERRPDIFLVGYDLSPEMVEICKKRFTNDKNILITDKWNDVVKICKKYKSTALVLSSVIHEVYSYSKSSDVRDFWYEKVFGGVFKWICIRDMIPSTNMNNKEKENFKKEVEMVKSKVDPYYLNSFEKRWGSIDGHYRKFIHFLLKYKYIDNWEREVNENYLPISLETLLDKRPLNYKVNYLESFTLHTLSEEVKRDFGFEIDHTTHSKIIFKKS